MADSPPPTNPSYQSEKQSTYPPAQNPAYDPTVQSQSYHAEPPPLYQPQVGQHTNVVITQPVVTVNAPTFRDYPVTVVDSSGQQVQTILEYRTGMLTLLICSVLCLFFGGFGLCCLGLIPFCINDVKDVYHITPTDGKVVGVYKRLS